MARQRRSFSTEFKVEAASLVVDQGYSMAEASRAVDVGESALRRWVNQLRTERDGVTPATKALTPEQQKIQELEARINRLEREKAIFKKATAHCRHSLGVGLGTAMDASGLHGSNNRLHTIYCCRRFATGAFVALHSDPKVRHYTPPRFLCSAW